MSIKMKRVDGEGGTLEFIAFNFDGEGSSLVLLEDGSLYPYSKEDTKEVFYGTNYNNCKYQFIKD